MSATTINSFPSLHSWNSPRSWALAIIAVLHLGFFWALSNGLSHTITKILEPLPPEFIPTTVKPEPKRPDPVDKVIIDPSKSVVTVVKPEPTFDFEPNEKQLYVPEPTPPETFTGPGSVVEPLPPTVVEPRIDARRGLSEPYYPPTVIREGGEGTVLLSIYILADGRVGEVRLDRSSGFAKLDESAMREAKRWRFVPGTSDGKPTAMWKQLPVTFRLNTRM